jgi:hypothetical protein
MFLMRELQYHSYVLGIVSWLYYNTTVNADIILKDGITNAQTPSTGTESQFCQPRIWRNVRSKARRNNREIALLS